MFWIRYFAIRCFSSPIVPQVSRADRVSGLMNGSLTINDIRNEAIDAREQLRELMEDLGPSGTSLQGYDGILNGFIKKTDPTHGTHAKANPATTLTSSPFASSPFASSPFAPRK